MPSCHPRSDIGEDLAKIVNVLNNKVLIV
jgi:hypothetical protein